VKQTHFTDWQGALESKDLKMNTSKTETVVYSKTYETLTVRLMAGSVLKQTETFKYLGSVG